MQIFNNIRLNNLKGDIYGGLTAAVVSLPMALAFGVASGAGAEAGLYGAVMVGLFAALFGGTSTLISEPTGPMTVVMTAVLTTLIADNPENGRAMAFTVVMMAGVFQIALGALKLGKYITLMPYSVISGFMSGIGIILIILQLAPLLGQPSPPGGVTGTLAAIPQLLANIRPVELLLGAATLAILFFAPKHWTRYIPAQLIALVVGTLLSLTVFGFFEVRRIGEIELGLPSLVVPTFSWDQWNAMILDALVLGTLGCIDALLTAVIADSLTREEHKSDKEMVGQGIGNLMSGLFGGLPGAGATMGTVVNIQTGARTALSGVVRAVILMIIILGAARLTESIPLAVLAGIAVMVGVNILDWSFVKRAHRVSVSATVIMYAVMFFTVFFDLIVAVGLGVFIANILTIERLSRVQTRNVKTITDADDNIALSKEERALLDKGQGKLLLLYLSGPMIFGVSKAIAREHNALMNCHALVVDISDVPLIDTTVSLAIENAIKDALDAGKEVFVVRPVEETTKVLEGVAVFQMIHDATLCESRLEALRRASDAIKRTLDSPKSIG
ncbi:SulP family inorganic anion transporter [Microbulbifer flavimaris]|uniref:SulP family inorganic anion transporter n=1 Tax=Microbulbifer flavimaris TaxID=1781068 RepID=A0ABX4I334_9GAMM|nr:MULTISPECIES: SulP family inorganic anion transporter [Microbulbifer]KUJ85023.1 Bicarbonate transporter BicA [Microbulbifer sp. ZGT114]PCO06751.1 SulP family inorganic anion transporter [Microbulbifer flavimaris]